MTPLILFAEHADRLFQGAWVTLQLMSLSVGLAMVLSLPLALAYRHGGYWAAPIGLYVSFMRGTPLIAQLFLFYYGGGQFRSTLQDWNLWFLFRDPFSCALLTLTLNSAAYQTVILRGALLEVPQGEWDAARAIGMSRLMRLRRVILPHVYRIAFPSLGNEAILMLKGSALASVVTVYDLMGQTRLIFARTFDLSVYLWAALMYLLLTAMLVLLWRWVERGLTRHLRMGSHR